MEKINRKYEIVKGVILIVIGIVALVISSNISIPGSTESKESYGGDAYTGIQNAAAQTATNVYQVGNGIEELYNQIMMFTGIAFIGIGILPFVKIYTSIEEKENKVTSNVSINNI